MEDEAYSLFLFDDELNAVMINSGHSTNIETKHYRRKADLQQKLRPHFVVYRDVHIIDIKAC